MKGLLVHNTRNIEKILLTEKLKSKRDLSKTPEFDWGGPRNTPMIFFSLMFEDKLSLINKDAEYLFWKATLFFDPKLIKDFASKKIKIKQEYKKFFINKQGESVKPKHKIWFNTQWIYGAFITDNENFFSVDYNDNLSLSKNIEIFHDAKVIAMTNNGFDYNEKYSILHTNEIVLFDEAVDISKYLLGIYIESDKQYERLKNKYPQYNIMNKSETNKFIKNYFEK
jgi:hypothetical protein